jgi:hypothetical protein
VGAAALERSQKPAAAAEPRAISLPDRIVLPADYRVLVLDGHLALVRVADAQALEPAPPSLRIVAGETGRGELAYQPALLPQELAQEVERSRSSSARMEAALADVMQRSRELSSQAVQIEDEGRRLAALLEGAQARIRLLESQPRAGDAHASDTGDLKDPPP